MLPGIEVLISRRVLLVALGFYVGMGVATALMAGPASQLASQASTPLTPTGSAVMGAAWPVTLPALLHPLRYPER
jgi:hypothetical protein